MLKKENKIFDASFWLSITVFIILIGLICFFPLWLTYPAEIKNLDFSTSGQIGDTIGGTMSPFIAIASSLLTFIAFWVQYKANQQQTRQFKAQAIEAEKTQIEKYYDNLNKDISEASFGEKKGVDAYLAYKLNNEWDNVILDNLNLVLYSFETYLRLIEKSDLISEPHKIFSMNRLHLLFYSKVLWPLHSTIVTDGKPFINGVKHDDSKITIRKFATLGISTINYLINNKLAVDSTFKQDNLKLLERLLVDEQNIEIN